VRNPYQLQDSKRWKITILGAAERAEKKLLSKAKAGETRIYPGKRGRSSQRKPRATMLRAAITT
jgi:hypothetical protein